MLVAYQKKSLLLDVKQSYKYQNVQSWVQITRSVTKVCVSAHLTTILRIWHRADYFCIMSRLKQCNMFSTFKSLTRSQNFNEYYSIPLNHLQLQSWTPVQTRSQRQLSFCTTTTVSIVLKSCIVRTLVYITSVGLASP